MPNRFPEHELVIERPNGGRISQAFTPATLLETIDRLADFVPNDATWRCVHRPADG